MRDVELTPEHSAAINAWRHEPPYDFYDYEHDPVVESPGRRHRAVLDDAGELVGFWELTPRDEEVEVGLGLRPDLTGRGLGGAFLESELKYARREWAPRRFRLYVAAWNERAIRVYARAGFREVARATRRFERFGEHEFVEMERDA